MMLSDVKEFLENNHIKSVLFYGAGPIEIYRLPYHCIVTDFNGVVITIDFDNRRRYMQYRVWNAMSFEEVYESVKLIHTGITGSYGGIVWECDGSSDGVDKESIMNTLINMLENPAA